MLRCHPSAVIMEEEILSNRRIVCVLFLVLPLVCNVFTVNAQLTRGAISGTVTDASGLVLVNAEVTVTNKATNILRTTTTNERGFFRFAAVEPGDYEAVFKLAGFDTLRVDPITVNTAQEVSVNQILTLTQVSSEISVTAVPGIDLAKTTATIE